MRKFAISPLTIAVFLFALDVFWHPPTASGGWVKIWEIADIKIVNPNYDGGLPPRDLNGDGTLDAVTGMELLFGGAGHVSGVLIFDLAHGVPEYQEASPSGEGVTGIEAIDLDHDGISELIVAWSSRLECLKWNGTPASPSKQEGSR